MAANPLSKFIATVKSVGVARNNRFQVEIFPPHHPRIVAPRDTLEVLQLYCTDVSLPGTVHDVAPYYIFGEPRHIPVMKSHLDITMRFLVDADMRVKKFFDSWCQCMFNPYNRTTAYNHDIVTTINVKSMYSEQLVNDVDQYNIVRSADDVVSYGVTLHHAFPKIVYDTSMRHFDRNAMEIAVTFAYQYWLPWPEQKAVENVRNVDTVASIKPTPAMNAPAPGQTGWTPDNSAGMSMLTSSEDANMSLIPPGEEVSNA